MRRASLITLMLLGIAALSGCSRSLFAGDKGNLTQFDAYDRMRGNVVPKTEPDVFGNPQPALRARLSQRD